MFVVFLRNQMSVMHKLWWYKTVHSLTKSITSVFYEGEEKWVKSYDLHSKFQGGNIMLLGCCYAKETGWLVCFKNRMNGTLAYVIQNLGPSEKHNNNLIKNLKKNFKVCVA